MILLMILFGYILCVIYPYIYMYHIYSMGYTYDPLCISMMDIVDDWYWEMIVILCFHETMEEGIGETKWKKNRWDTWLSSMGNMRRHEETTYMRIKSGDPPKAAYQGSFSCPPSFSPKYQLNGDFLSHGGTPQIKPDYFSIEAFETHGLGDLSFHESPKWACYQYRALILIGEILKFYLRHLWFQPILWRRCVLESW